MPETKATWIKIGFKNVSYFYIRSWLVPASLLQNLKEKLMSILDGKDDNVKQEVVEVALSSVALPTLEQMLAYAKRGFHVLPLEGKAPLVDGGYKTATTDEKIIRRWGVVWPDANIGIATGVKSDDLVVDVDPRSGGDESFKRLKPLLVNPSNNQLGTPVVLTGGGGFHLHYECKLPIRSQDLQGYPGIEILADKKYVVAPPSIHPDTGEPYRWHEKRSLENTPLAPIPEGLLSLIMDKGAGATPPSVRNNSKTNPLDGFPNFHRHSGLRDYAWSLCHETKLSQQEVLALVLQAASNCTPPCDPKEATALVTSAFEKLKCQGLEIISGPDLVEKQLPPPRYTIECVLSEGLVLLSAGPKKGKSTLARNMAVSVAEGTLFAGRFRCEQGQVLYLSLEEGERAMQSYLKKMGQSPSQLSIAFNCPRGTDAVRAIEKWIESVENPRLVVVDLLERVRRDRKYTESLYGYDTDSLFAFRTITAKYPGLTILVLHHNRKKWSQKTVQ